MNRRERVPYILPALVAVGLIVAPIVYQRIWEPIRLEENEARGAVMRIVLPARFELEKDLRAQVGEALESAESVPLLDLGYDLQEVKCKRAGPGRYRMWLAVSLQAQCIGDIRTQNLLNKDPGPSPEEVNAPGLAECERRRAVLEPLLRGWQIEGCEEEAEFLVTLGEPPSVVPQNLCAQTLTQMASQQRKRSVESKKG